MSIEGKISQLADLCGIYREYWDIWGGRHPVQPPTERIFLTAMGHDLSDEAAVDAAIERQRRKPWGQCLPPVIVLNVGEPVMVSGTFPRETVPEQVDWVVTAESGQSFEGKCTASQVEVVEERELDGQILARWRIALGRGLETGYHHLRVRAPSGSAQTTIIIAPARCYQPGPASGTRSWGVSLQLYSLRSQRNWGIGDFTDLQAAGQALGALGADFLGINPLHALYPGEPERASPYSPSSRRFLNPLYLDPEALEDFSASAEGQAMLAEEGVQDALQQLREASYVDYFAVAGLKRRAFDIAHRHFHDHHLCAMTARGQAFHQFSQAHAPELDRYALFEGLLEAHGNDRGALPAPDDPQAIEFAQLRGFELQRTKYLQWQCEEQLARCAARCRDAGMRIGLYRDLAVGCDSGGADVWADPHMYAEGVNAGAPPDELAVQGQAWGLSPWKPDTLRSSAYRSFVDCVRANMRHAGALRIDHVVGLMRQFWVPNALGAAAGGYVVSPFAELLAVLALESERAQCLVIGEDLGTVPDEVRSALYDHAVLSYRVLYFEKRWEGDHGFRRPYEYPEVALATTATHDLPTLAGYCTGSDLEIRRRLGLFPSPEADTAQVDERRRDVGRLAEALSELQLGPTPEFGQFPDEPVSAAIHQFLARTPTRLMNAQIEDLLGEREQMNVPGTTTEEPNWRRKLAVGVELWPEHSRLTLVTERLRSERPPSS